MSAPELSAGPDGKILVKGRLDVTTVAACKTLGDQLIEAAETVVFDLGESEVKGSAVIALLIAWQREAALLSKPISFVNAPENLLDIAEVCGVSEIIPFG